MSRITLAHTRKRVSQTRAQLRILQKMGCYCHIYIIQTQKHTHVLQLPRLPGDVCVGIVAWLYGGRANGSSRRNMDRIRMAKNGLPKHAHTHIVVRHTACAIVRRKVHAGTTHGFNCRKCCAVLERWVLCSPNPLPKDSTHDKTSKIAKAKAIKWQIR